MPEFKKRGFKLADMSCNSVEDHRGWIDDIKAYNQVFPVPYNLFVTSKNETTNSPIHEFKVLQNVF